MLRLYYKLADAYSRVEKFDEAEKLLQRSIWLDATSTGPYILLGKVLQKKGETELAVRALQRALAMDPNNSIPHHLLGQAYRELGARGRRRARIETGGKLMQIAAEMKTSTPHRFCVTGAPKNTIVGLGELLWDVFSERKELGGAPANFAYMTSLLGDEGVVASRVGTRSPGKCRGPQTGETGAFAGMAATGYQHPTGTAKVDIGDDGQPKFEIAEGVAWDHFEWTPNGKRWRDAPRGVFWVAGATLRQSRERATRCFCERFAKML